MSVRSRVQRAFVRWLEDAQPQLKRYIIITSRTDQATELTFDVETAALQGWVSKFGLAVAVTYQDKYWDLLLDLDVISTAVKGGFVCDLCQPKTLFSSKEDLRSDHLFEPLRKWVNEELAGATSIALFQLDSSGSATWAALNKTADPNPKAFVSLSVAPKIK